MSHDRGCPCGKEGRDDYELCNRDDCYRRTNNGAKYHHTSIRLPDVVHTIVIGRRHQDEITAWCHQQNVNAGDTAEKYIVRGGFIDIKCQELYTMFKLTWG